MSDTYEASLIDDDSSYEADQDFYGAAPDSIVSINGTPTVDKNTRLLLDLSGSEEVIIPTLEDLAKVEEGSEIVAGSYVSFEQKQTDGDEIGTITIDGVSAKMYAPKHDTDAALSSSSQNAIQNRAVYAALAKKYEKPESGIPAKDLEDGVIPTSLKNPYPLVINDTTYDGSKKVEITVKGGTSGAGGSGPVAAECVILGDSLSSGYKSGGTTDTSNHYDRAWPVQLLNDGVCEKVWNHAYYGAQIKDYADDDGQPSLIEQYSSNKSSWSSPDLFILEGGSNDSYYFATHTTYSYNDAKEALSSLIDAIHSDYPDARIVFVRSVDWHESYFTGFYTSPYLMDVLTVLCREKRVQVISYTGTTLLSDSDFNDNHPSTAACEIIGHYIGSRLYDRVTYFPEGPVWMYFANSESSPNTYHYDFESIKYLIQRGCDVVACIKYSGSTASDVSLLALRWAGEFPSSGITFIGTQYATSGAMYVWMLAYGTSAGWTLKNNKLISWA